MPAERRAALRAELGASEGTLLAATVAIFREGKGHDDLLAAAALLGEIPVRFVLAGSGPEEARLRARVAAEGLGDRVVFAGFREDVGDLLAAADLVVHPSHADALPTALIQALAAGVPAVATAVGGIPEIVGDDAGVLVLPADPGALAAAVRVLAGDPARRRLMGEAARPRFARRFEGSAWARRLKALYDEVLAEGRPPR